MFLINLRQQDQQQLQKLKYQLLEDANKEIDRLRGRLKDYEV